MTQIDVAAPSKPTAGSFTWGTGRRKAAVARVRIRPGEGKFLINDRALEEYFPREGDRLLISAPLTAANGAGKWDIFVNVQGGGLTGQTGAVVLGLARALVKAEPTSEQSLRDQGLLTRDARKVERKKYGRSGARRGFQFSKR
jgi:small subunit ribosomal protein S9